MIIKLVRHGSGKGHIIHHKRVGVLNTQNREAWYEQKENNRISRCCRGLYSGLCIYRDKRQITKSSREPGGNVAPEKEGMVHFIGFAALMALMVFVMYNDIMRLF